MDYHHPLRTKDQEPTTRLYAEQNAKAEARAKTCRSATMPSLDHLHMQDYQNVYEPSDDTYLLIDAIGMDFDAMDNLAETQDVNDVLVRSNIRKTLEIGCGTGVPSIYLAMRLRQNKESNADESGDNQTNNNTDNTMCHHFVTDINPEAIRIATVTAEVNGIPSNNFKAHQCDLATDLLSDNENSIDILIFNPPYVPTPDDEVGSNGIEASWAGGTNGRVVLDRALPQIAQLLAFPHGVGYLVVVDDNYPEEIARILLSQYGIKAAPWLRRRARNEFLTIMRLIPTRKYSAVS
jgi:release factor glutamine methyltransferase